MKKLPRKVHEKHGALYWVHRNRWHRLCPVGATDSELRQALARVQGEARPRTVGELLELYGTDGLADLAPRTQASYRTAIERTKPLYRVFGTTAIAAVLPHHVAQYLEGRKKQGSPVAGNRERAVLSSAFTFGMRHGYCDSNPCIGVRRNKESPRSRYIEDAELLAVMNAASPAVQDAITIAYLTGMRKGDLLNLTKAAITKEGIAWREGKTKRQRLVEWSPALRFVVKRAKKRSECDHLLTRSGLAPWSEDGFTGGWRRTMERAGVAGFTFHDLRAKAGSDHPDGFKLLAHGSRATFERIYRRKARGVRPTQ